VDDGWIEEGGDEVVKVGGEVGLCVFGEQVVGDKGELRLCDGLSVALLCGEFVVEWGENFGDGFLEGHGAADDGVDEHDEG